MNSKELKNFAKQIAKNEAIVLNREHRYSENEISQAKSNLESLSKKNLHSFEDLDTIDELVQEFLQKF